MTGSLSILALTALSVTVSVLATQTSSWWGQLGDSVESPYLSDIDWSVATNGFGRVERDASSAVPGLDGDRKLSINGTVYAKGLGTRAPSDVRYALEPLKDEYRTCTTFATDVGVDDVTGGRGSVVFQVWADGTKLYDSGVVTGGSPHRHVSVDLTGRKELALVVTDAGDGGQLDNADWAGAQLLCNGLVEAKVTAAMAGDSLDATIFGVRTGVAYLGVETPQGNQPCGPDALARNRELADGRVLLKAEPAFPLNPLGLRLFYAYTPAGVWIDEVLVREGLGRAARIGSRSAYLAAVELDARVNKRGCLWRDAGITP